MSEGIDGRVGSRSQVCCLQASPPPSPGLLRPSSVSPRACLFIWPFLSHLDRHPSLYGRCPSGSRGFEVDCECPSWCRGGQRGPGCGLPSVLRLRAALEQCAPVGCSAFPPGFQRQTLLPCSAMPASSRQGSCALGRAASVQLAPSRGRACRRPPALQLPAVSHQLFGALPCSANSDCFFPRVP